jgi:sec-independent protein translocase protein TatC
MSYFVIFPFSIRFLGTYQVSEDVVNMINLSSYISTFTALTFMMGIVFQIPVISFFLAKMGILEAEFMARYRRHALIIIMILAAIITPPDIFTLVLVTIPMYALYELSILIVKRIN